MHSGHQLVLAIVLGSAVSCGAERNASEGIYADAVENQSVAVESDSSLTSAANETLEVVSLPEESGTWVNPLIGYAPMTVACSTLSIPDCSIMWDFGDGGHAEGTRMEHVYHHPGTYLVVTNISNGIETVSDTVHVTLYDSSLSMNAFHTMLDELEGYRESHYPGTELALWAENTNVGYVAFHEDDVRAAASALKLFILLAAYRQYGDEWLSVPEDLDRILAAEEGFEAPLSHFNEEAKQQVRANLRNMTYAELAYSMMGNNQNQIGNSAYNASANILIYLLGGPNGGCTQHIHDLHPEFRTVRIGRYMLEDRTESNENVCSLRDLMVACRLLFYDGVSDVTPEQHNDIRSAMQCFSYQGYANFQKHGHLTSIPGVNIWVGWIEAEGECLFYGVHVLRPNGTSVSDEGADYYRDRIIEEIYSCI